MLLAAFLIGSVPFGVLLAKLCRLPDPRTIGSGNIGATNMLRTGRKDIAALTLLLDGGKGAAAVLLATRILDASPTMAATVALIAALGHMYSPWLDFKGGKGVATSLGGILAVSPLAGGFACAIWLLVFAVRGISSLAAIVAFAALPLIVYGLLGFEVAAMIAILCVWVIFKHRANIERLLHGNEPRFRGTKGKKS